MIDSFVNFDGRGWGLNYAMDYAQQSQTFDGGLSRAGVKRPAPHSGGHVAENHAGMTHHHHLEERRSTGWGVSTSSTPPYQGSPYEDGRSMEGGYYSSPVAKRSRQGTYIQSTVPMHQVAHAAWFPHAPQGSQPPSAQVHLPPYTRDIAYIPMEQQRIQQFNPTLYYRPTVSMSTAQVPSGRPPLAPHQGADYPRAGRQSPAAERFVGDYSRSSTPPAPHPSPVALYSGQGGGNGKFVSHRTAPVTEVKRQDRISKEETVHQRPSQPLRTSAVQPSPAASVRMSPSVPSGRKPSPLTAIVPFCMKYAKQGHAEEWQTSQLYHLYRDVCKFLEAEPEVRKNLGAYITALDPLGDLQTLIVKDVRPTANSTKTATLIQPLLRVFVPYAISQLDAAIDEQKKLHTLQGRVGSAPSSNISQQLDTLIESVRCWGACGQVCL